MLIALACRATGGPPDAAREPRDAPPEPRRAEASREPAVIFHPDGEPALTVAVEVADTDAARERGLMFRKHLDPMHGMLFVFPNDANHTFWMKNTPLSLDMVFIDSELRVVGIVKRATPFDETSRGIGRESRYVVEVNAGFADAHGVRVGSRVTLRPPPRE